MSNKGNNGGKVRLDVLVSELGHRRGFAKELIQNGNVKVGGVTITSPGASFAKSEVNIECDIPGKVYVSRGGYKLEHALKHFEINASGLICADIGASTGGFTDCLLENGAKKVYAVDNGNGQLDKKLFNDARVINMENVNAKYLKLDMFPDIIDFICIDVSFISVTKIIYVLNDILKPGGEIICLIKPQFEAGKNAANKRGIVKNVKSHENAIKLVQSTFLEYKFNMVGYIKSPITGLGGNIEYLAYFSKVII